MEMDIKLEGIDKVVAKLSPDIYKKALNATLNDVGKTIKSETSKEIRKTYKMKAGALKKALEVKKSKTNDLEWTLSTKTKRSNIISFGARKVALGISVDIKNGRKTIRGAFIGNNGKTVFKRIKGTQMSERKTKYSHSSKTGKRYKREKITAVTTLSVTQMFDDKIKSKMNKLAKEKATSRFKHHFEYYIGVR